MGAQMDTFGTRNDDTNEEVNYMHNFKAAQRPSWELSNSRNSRNYANDRYREPEPEPPQMSWRRPDEDNRAVPKSNQEFQDWYLSPAAKAPTRPKLPEDWYTGYTQSSPERRRRSLIIYDRLEEDDEDLEDERDLRQMRRQAMIPTAFNNRSPVHRNGFDRNSRLDDDVFRDDSSMWSRRERRAQVYQPPQFSRPRFVNGGGFKNGAVEDQRQFFDGNFPEENRPNGSRSRFTDRFATERAPRSAAPQMKRLYDDEIIYERRRNEFRPPSVNDRFATERAHRNGAAQEARRFFNDPLPDEQMSYRRPPKPVPEHVERFAFQSAQRNGVTQTAGQSIYSEDFSPREQRNAPFIFNNNLLSPDRAYGNGARPWSKQSQTSSTRAGSRQASTQMSPSFLIREPATAVRAYSAPRTISTQTVFKTENKNGKNQQTLNCGRHILDKTYINIGFVGASKTGKSAIINALRGLSKDDAGYAGPKPKRRGITKYDRPEITPYKCAVQGFENCVLWEIPIDIPIDSEQFIRNNSLYEFDLVFLLIAGAISKDEVSFSTTMSSYQIPFAFLMPGCDKDMKVLEDQGNAHPFGRFKARFEQNARSIFNGAIEDIAPALTAIPVFFISAPVIKDRHHLKFENDEQLPTLVERYAIDENAFLSAISEVCQSRH